MPKNSRLYLYRKMASVSRAHVGQRQQHIGPADALKMIKNGHPAVVDIILDALRRREESMTIQTVVECAAVLERTGFECPSWEGLAEGR